MSQAATPTRRVSPFAKMAFQVQMFLLRRNWMGSASNFIMIVTTTGRKSGKRISTPIGYQRDGDNVLAFNVGGISNWYKNLQKNPVVTLEIKKTTYQMRGTYITDRNEIRQVMELYKREQASMLPRFFGIPADASEDDLMKAAERIKFVRFQPV